MKKKVFDENKLNEKKLKIFKDKANYDKKLY